MPKSTFKYTNNEVTVVWKPDTCIHSRICWTQLRDVFDPAKRPWINMEASNTATIIEQVKKCPSGALSYYLNAEGEKEEKTETETAAEASILNIEIKKNGPILITTDCVITHGDGSKETKQGTTALCRCGQSANKPYCDGTHRKIGFETEK
jgi:uncharacterized Fe-S cluster protein YjdI